MGGKIDIHQHITNRIIAAIEAGAGEWRMPWHAGSGGRLPVNAETGKRYRGVNTLGLWVEAQANGYSSHIWGTYRQWAAKGAQVRKGAKASYVVFYREIGGATDGEADSVPETRLIARATPVFNADQVEGLPETIPETSAEPTIPIANAEAFAARTGARIIHEGAMACYNRRTDEIRMPPREAFIGSATSTPVEAYYAILFHELTHWTGIGPRCNRDLTGRFGSSAYAMEELVAEIGAAYLTSELGIAAEPRPDHAQYLAHWLQVLKADKRAVFTAASKASQAVDYLHTLQAHS